LFAFHAARLRYGFKFSFTPEEIKESWGKSALRTEILNRFASLPLPQGPKRSLAAEQSNVNFSPNNRDTFYIFTNH